MKMVDVVSKTHEHYVLFCGAMHVSVPIRVAQRVCVCTCYPLAQTRNLGKSRHGNFQAARRGCHALYMSWRRCCLPALSRHHPRSRCLPALSCQLKAFDSAVVLPTAEDVSAMDLHEDALYISTNIHFVV